MNQNELIAKLIQLATKRFSTDAEQAKSIRADDDFFESLGIDSFQAMELMTDLEEELDVEIPDYELQGVNTFEKLADVIAPRL